MIIGTFFLMVMNAVLFVVAIIVAAAGVAILTPP
jgi:archaellum component FlaG (FlaF/FlaG flagellin family)